jgi:formylglycine-generating enzyme required for sulfatase activity
MSLLRRTRRAIEYVAAMCPAAIVGCSQPHHVAATSAATPIAQLPPESRDSVAKQAALIALAKLRDQPTDSLWSLFRQSDDNARRSYMIHFASTAGPSAAVMIRRLRDERDASARRALVLALGGYGPGDIQPDARADVVRMLLTWYRDDPDAGLHGAIDWLLRSSPRGAQRRSLDWGQAQALASLDNELTGGARAGRNWYVTAEGQTMSIVDRPGEFRMGAPADEVGRVPASDSPDEPLHVVRIPRSFAVGAKEVTIAEFRRFLNANPDARAEFAAGSARLTRVLNAVGPDSEAPQIDVTWYEAAMFCNWLSKRERLPESEWVYPVESRQMKSGMELPPQYLHRLGYRLPTEAEWEFAARAGTVTSRFYGSGAELLEDYVWYAKHPQKNKTDPFDPSDPPHTWPVGELLPNDLGLFDVYGNVWEWTQDRLVEQFPPNMIDTEDSIRVVRDSVSRSRRGGGFVYPAADQRSANRDSRNAFPMLRRGNVGFRVARTYP